MNTISATKRVMPLINDSYCCNQKENAPNQQMLLPQLKEEYPQLMTTIVATKRRMPPINDRYGRNQKKNAPE